jgi:hypothetical protein
MLINFSGVFTEVNTKFKISFKVHKLLMKLLTDLDLQAKLPMSKTNRDAIGFIESTSRNCVEIKVSEPQYPRKSRFVDISIMLPFLEIDNEDQLLFKYLENLEIACLIGFKKLGIIDERISNVFSLVKKEVIGNKEYEYNETLT